MINLRVQYLPMHFFYYVQFHTLCRKSSWIFFIWRMNRSSHTSTVPRNLVTSMNYLQCKYIYDRVKEYLIQLWRMKYATVVWLDLFCLFNIKNLFSIHLFVSKMYLLLYTKHSCHNIKVKIWTHTIPFSFTFG